jgi:hypothetical protein
MRSYSDYNIPTEASRPAPKTKPEGVNYNSDAIRRIMTKGQEIDERAARMSKSRDFDYVPN